MNPRLQHNTEVQRLLKHSLSVSPYLDWSHLCLLHCKFVVCGQTMELKSRFIRNWFVGAFGVAVWLTTVWLSITWCSRMIKRAEALIDDPKDNSPMSDPLYAWNKHHKDCVRHLYYYIICRIISWISVSRRDTKKSTSIPMLVAKRNIAVAQH